MAACISHIMFRLVNSVRQRSIRHTKYLTIGPSSYFDRACLCLNSFSAPDAFLDILSQEIIRFSLPADIRAEPVSDAAVSGGT